MKKRTQRLLGTAALLAFPLLAMSAPAAVDSITTSPSTSATLPIDDADGSAFTLADLTADGATYTSPAGANVVNGNPVDVGDYYYIGTDPGSVTAATEGLLMNATAAGGSNGNGDYAFSSPDTGDTFFLFEIGGNDAFTLKPIDASGNTLGTYSLTLQSGDFGGVLLTLDTPHRGSGGSDASSHFQVHGVAFTLSDFSGSGSLSSFAGFNITTSGGDVCALAASGAGTGGGGGGPLYASYPQMLINWGMLPWGLEPLDTSASATYTTTENGGLDTTYSFSDPLENVDVSDPDNPDFSSATASDFGYGDSGMNLGVGDGGVGRLERGESFTFESSRDFLIEQMYWKSVDGDEKVHISWTADGNAEELVLDITQELVVPPTDIVADANTPVVFTNVSDTSSPNSGRLGFRYMTVQLVFPSPVTYSQDSLFDIEQMVGVNLAGMEFSSGTYRQDTDPDQWDYYHDKGLDLVRLPFKWERLQPSLSGSLDSTYLGYIEACVDLAAARGMKVVLDVHNYARYNGNVIGAGTGVTNADFADLWYRLADHFEGDPGIYAYGIMNEPFSTDDHWPGAAQAAVNGIRQTDADTWIIIGGHGYSSAKNWQQWNDDLIISDPRSGDDRLMYEAHFYFDSDSNGSYGSYDGEGGSPDRGLIHIANFVGWLQANDVPGFIGEIGIPDDDSRWVDDLDRTLSYLYVNGLSVAYWAGGTSWNNYELDIHPLSNYTVDRPQMAALENYGILHGLVEDFVMDSEDGTGISLAGSWGDSTYQSGYNGSGYKHDGDSGKGAKSVTYTPGIGAAGYYEVLLKWTSSSNRASNVPVDVNHMNGAYYASVDQTSGGGQWNSLGAFLFDAGTGGDVRIANDGTNGYVIADAVRFIRRSGTIPDIVLDSENAAGIELTGTWGSSTTQFGYNGDNYLHDQNSGKGSKSVTYTPDILYVGDYDVYVRWTSGSNRATNVPLEITHDGGQTHTTTLDQTSGGGQWNHIGTFAFASGTGDHIVLSTTGTNGYVIADAVKLVWSE